MNGVRDAQPVAGALLLAALLCNGCATYGLREATGVRTHYWGGPGEPKACLAANGTLRVFEQGLYGRGDGRYDPPNSWHRIDLPLSRILSSLTNGQTSVQLHVRPKPVLAPDPSPRHGPGGRAIPVRFVRIQPDAELPADAFPEPRRAERIGTNLVQIYAWDRSRHPDSALIAYLERHPSATNAHQELLYLEEYQRKLWIWYDCNGLKNAHRCVLTIWEYPPDRTRGYLRVFYPFAVAFDIVTLPVQAVYFYHAMQHIQFF